jgi:hypothetical protein
MPIVMTYEDAIIRYRLRLARTSIGVLTDGDEERRRSVFWASLQQFEELLDAAGRVGPASRPLPLFYALSQAGRAITAAHGSVPWELRGHGLKLSRDSSQPLLERTVRPEPNRAGDDSYSRVSETIGSAVLTRPVELGAIWASLPFEIPKPWAHKWPTTLQVKSLIRPTGMTASDLQLMDLEGRPLTSEAGAFVGPFTVDQLTADTVHQILEQYPTAQGWYFPDSSQPPGVRDPHGWSAVLAWRADGVFNNDRVAKLSEVAPEYRYSGHRWLRPAVGPQRDYLEPSLPGGYYSTVYRWWPAMSRQHGPRC